MWGTQNLKLLQSAKEIWDHLLQCRITVTVECLPSELKVTADWEPRNNSDSSEWNLALQLSQRICQLRGTPEKDLFASHQIRTISSDQDLLFVETRSIKPSSRCLPTKLVPQVFMLFPHFAWSQSFEERPQKKYLWWYLQLQPGHHNCGTQKQWECPYNNPFSWFGGEIS